MKFAIALVFVVFFVWTSQAKPATEEMFQVEGDMLLTKDQLKVYAPIKNGRTRRAALKDRYLWPKGVVYYTFKGNLDKAGQNLAKKAMEEWTKKTCLKFVKRTNQRNYAEFQYGGDCRAAVGYAKRPRQLISIGSKSKPCSLGASIHEIGHAIGFFHEQNRPDRDDYITIKEENMRPEQWVKDQFNKADERWIDTRDQDYDYKSIMHYSRYQGSKQWGKPVMVPKKPNVELGQRDGLSEGDIKQTKLMYKCNDKDESELNYNEDEDTDTDTEKTDGKTKGPKPGEVES